MVRVIEMVGNRIIYCANFKCNKLAVVWVRDRKVHEEDTPLCREHINQLLGKEDA